MTQPLHSPFSTAQHGKLKSLKFNEFILKTKNNLNFSGTGLTITMKLTLNLKHKPT